MNRTKLLTALFAAGFLTTGAMAQGTPPKTKPAKPVVAAMTADTTKKKPLPTPKHKGKKPKPVKPDTTKTKKPN